MFNDGLKKGESRKIVGKEDWIRGNSQRVLPQTQETMVPEIKDRPGHHHQEMILIQATMDRIMVEEEAEDKALQGDQNALTLLTHK